MATRLIKNCQILKFELIHFNLIQLFGISEKNWIRITHSNFMSTLIFPCKFWHFEQDAHVALLTTWLTTTINFKCQDKYNLTWSAIATMVSKSFSINLKFQTKIVNVSPWFYVHHLYFLLTVYRCCKSWYYIGVNTCLDSTFTKNDIELQLFKYYVSFER